MLKQNPDGTFSAADPVNPNEDMPADLSAEPEVSSHVETAPKATMKDILELDLDIGKIEESYDMAVKNVKIFMDVLSVIKVLADNLEDGFQIQDVMEVAAAGYAKKDSLMKLAKLFEDKKLLDYALILVDTAHLIAASEGVFLESWKELHPE